MSELDPQDLTVIIPARDAGMTVGATISSLVGQRAGKPRIILVDDGSTDGTAAVAAQIGLGADLLVISSAGEGPGAARNRGLAAVTTPLVAFCDADDQWVGDRLGADLACFNSDENLEVLLGRSLFVADDEELLRCIRFDGPDRAALIPSVGATTMRTSVFERVGLVDGSLHNYEDYEWLYRARDCGTRVVSHDRVVQISRVRPDSTSRRNPPSPSDLLAVIHRSVLRRRTAGVLRADRLDQLGRTL